MELENSCLFPLSGISLKNITDWRIVLFKKEIAYFREFNFYCQRELNLAVMRLDTLPRHSWSAIIGFKSVINCGHAKIFVCMHIFLSHTKV